MIFKGIENQSVEFKIVNYQFPENNTPGDWDSNWLHIYIKVQSKFGNWQTVDPSLTTGEFKELVEWFRDLSENREVKYTDLIFTEPNLEFELKKKEENSKEIRIRFYLESRPQSAQKYPLAKDDQYYVDCIFTNHELGEISRHLEEELKKFPSR